MTTPMYFTHGTIIAKSGNVKIYELAGERYLEIGPGHTLWAVSDEIVEYKDQIGNKPGGDCLEIGLGLGVASNYILSCAGVNKLTTVETNKDVIDTYMQLSSPPYNKPNHYIVNENGCDYLLQTCETFDFIFLDFYDLIDEEILEDIRVYVELSKRKLNDGGKIVGWYDIYTADDFVDEFFKLFKGEIL
ncbi:hypothetical protein LCGC14_1529880 [marine sediment metagenome]|uniref:Methyltransferase type 11 domain-containing protein n=1 Tax=marine sediment metagenome TaxID=412755 RepID=A0A0F9LX32_9ZZZZ